MGHRPYMRRAQDEARAVALAASGETQRGIAATLGVGLATVNRHLQNARAQWSQEAMGDIAALQSRELSSLEKVEAEAWRAWQKSKRSVNGGDPRLLDIVTKVSVQRARMLGLNALKPSTVIQIEPPPPDDGLNELERRMQKYADIIAIPDDDGVIDVLPTTPSSSSFQNR